MDKSLDVYPPDPSGKPRTPRTTPGTSVQTGNDAPRFDWRRDRVGRFARVLVHLIAEHLHYTDSQMGLSRLFPSSATTYALFTRTLPWFPAYYNDARLAKALARNYPAILLEPLNAAAVHNRLLYEFTTPGEQMWNERHRTYGMSKEHPLSEYQSRPGGRREVYDRCRDEVLRRLAAGESVTLDEARTWGA